MTPIIGASTEATLPPTEYASGRNINYTGLEFAGWLQSAVAAALPKAGIFPNGGEVNVIVASIVADLDKRDNPSPPPGAPKLISNAIPVNRGNIPALNEAPPAKPTGRIIGTPA